MLLLVEQVPAQVESQNGKNSMVRDLLYKFLVQAMLFKAEVFLSELGLKHETLRHGIGALEEGIVFLIKSEINRPKKDDSEDEKLLLADFKQLAAEVSSVCSCADNLESQLSGLLDKLEPLKLNLRRLYFRRPNSGFPKTPGVGRVESLLERLKEKQDSLACAAYQIEVICTDLELCLKHSDADETARGPLVEAAYQIEHVIDSMGGTKYSESLLLMWLYDQSLEIKNLTVHIRNTPPIPKQRSVPPPIPKQSKIPPHALDDETSPMVGFQEEKADMIHRLTTDSKCLEVVSIIGMPGSGKSTLARDVFSSPAIVHHFGTRVKIA